MTCTSPAGPGSSATTPRVLILGGTSEARALAVALEAAGWPFTSSLAGRVSAPRLPVGAVRIGGFGGVDGLVQALRDGAYTHLVDATHPFATTMRTHAVAAAARAGIPVVRLARPGWRARPEADSWHWVRDHAEADVVAARLGSRPFLTTGRQTLDAYSILASRPCLVRVVEAPSTVPPTWTVLRTRGPFDVAGERQLMTEHGVDVLVTKDSGGAYTAAKLTAAQELGLPVVIVERPADPAGLESVAEIDAVLAWLRR